MNLEAWQLFRIILTLRLRIKPVTMVPYLISLTSCLLASNFTFQSLTSTSLVMIWRETFIAVKSKHRWREAKLFNFVPPLWWGWELPVFLPHWCRWNPGLGFLFSSLHSLWTCSSVCMGPHTAERRKIQFQDSTYYIFTNYASFTQFETVISNTVI